ncbi:MAG: polysaccharide deacetylase family protein [Clostridia bacterium]|nr:polysaccharide deacetylase family protein [Clostridia bacterium]
MQVSVKNKLLTLALVLLVAVFAVISAALDRRTAVETAAGQDLPIYAVKLPEDEKKVALTFDAAWGNEDTGELIDILDRYGVKATFFVIGQWADKYPDSVRDLADAGHDVMNHSWDHPHFTKLSGPEMVKNADRASDRIFELTGVRPTLFRAPYGDYDAEVIRTMRAAGYVTIQWDVDSLDWKDLSAKEITDRVLSRVKSGSIVLFHNAAKHTPEALPGIIEALKSEGYEIVKVDDMIYKSGYVMDHEGRQTLLEGA